MYAHVLLLSSCELLILIAILILEFVFIMAVHCVVVYQKYCQDWNMNTAGHIVHYVYIVHILYIRSCYIYIQSTEGHYGLFTSSLTPLDLQTNGGVILGAKDTSNVS